MIWLIQLQVLCHETHFNALEIEENLKKKNWTKIGEWTIMEKEMIRNEKQEGMVRLESKGERMRNWEREAVKYIFTC